MLPKGSDDEMNVLFGTQENDSEPSTSETQDVRNRREK